MPSTIILVDHSLVRTFYKGAIGQIVIDGEANPEIFGIPAGQEETVEDTAHGAPVDYEVSITENAYLPENEEHAYDPAVLELTPGKSVRWTNHDIIAHTVTSGLSDGLAGVPDGRFDSGYIDAGGTFTYTFEEEGTFSYYCLPHPWMRHDSRQKLRFATSPTPLPRRERSWILFYRMNVSAMLITT